MQVVELFFEYVGYLLRQPESRMYRFYVMWKNIRTGAPPSIPDLFAGVDLVHYPLTDVKCPIIATIPIDR